MTSGTLTKAAIVRLFVDSQRLIVKAKSDQMCEIRLTKLPYVAQQVGIVHFYAVAEIKGLSCRPRWMDEWKNLLTSTHVGLSCGQPRVMSHKNLGSKVRRRLTDFRELTAREMTGFDCTCDPSNGAVLTELKTWGRKPKFLSKASLPRSCKLEAAANPVETADTWASWMMVSFSSDNFDLWSFGDSSSLTDATMESASEA